MQSQRREGRRPQLGANFVTKASINPWETALEELTLPEFVSPTMYADPVLSTAMAEP